MWKFLILILFLPWQAPAQSITPIAGGDLPNARVLPPETYDLESVLIYNNAADLFLEFGFKSLMVQEIAWGNERLKAEVYLLGSPEEAFGAYSLSVVSCTQRDTLCKYDCSTRYQYQAAYGNLYISITGESGSDNSRSYYLPVAMAIMHGNPQQTLVLPEPFDLPVMKKARKNLVYIGGPTGLQNSLYPWQDLFLSVRFGMYAIFLANPENEIYFSRIRFESPPDMRRFLELSGLMQDGIPLPNTNTNDGLYRAFQQVKQDDPLTIYFLQSQEPWPIDAVLTPRN
ncbi:MAG: DUF6599 family protein [bacterium]